MHSQTMPECELTSKPVMSQYFLGGYMEGGASMLTSAHHQTTNHFVLLKIATNPNPDYT
jgi:hypothetical protein